VNAVAFYANSILWLYLVIAYERHGSRCRICHPIPPLEETA
jgi:hypothetical protein